MRKAISPEEAAGLVLGRMVPGMGGAMDLASGAKRVVVAMTHMARGSPKLVP